MIDELRRLNAADNPTAEGDASPFRSPARSVHQIAQGLLTGHFVATPAESATEADSANGQPAADLPGPTARQVPAGSAILSGSGRNFAKEVARVGLQVAEAMDYAHGQGVLHGDI